MATRPIDEKIVAMKMDNSDFVKKASSTTKLMSRLTEFLNKIPKIELRKTTTEFRNINKSIDQINSSRLADSVETISNRFTTMGIIGTTALTNIANRAVDAGLSMVKHLTIAPVMDGFREYETKIGSIQTILANTTKYGTTVDDVTKALGELNHYADQTIYNFGDMTKNIGLFTNAGLKLEESTSMIKGFANAAAASGANAEKMAAAAYQLSQGLSSGYIMQMDWMSLTNAGMGNDNMKRDLIALGQAMGTLTKSTGETITTWKESLSDDKWLTKEVFSTYLQTMAGDLDKARLRTIGLTEAQADLLLQNAKIGNESAVKVRTFTQMMSTLAESIGSGWSESWEIIFGGFEDATQLWTGFSELVSAPFKSMTESRNHFLKSLKDAGVFETLFTSLGTAIYVVGRAIDAVTSGFTKAFSSDKFNIVSSLVQGFKNLVSAITPSEASLVKIATIFQSVGSTVMVIIKLISQFGKLMMKLIPDNLGSGILTILEKLAKMNLAFNEAILKGDGVKGAFAALGKVFSWIGNRISDVIDGFSTFASIISIAWIALFNGRDAANQAVKNNSKIASAFGSIHDVVDSLIKGMMKLDDILKPISNAFKSFFSSIKKGFEWMKDKLSGIGNSIKESMPDGNTIFAGGFIVAIMTFAGFVLKTVHDITQIFSEWGNVVEGFADVLDSVSGALDAFALNLSANALLTASIAVGALALSVLMLSRVDGSRVSSSLTAIVGSLTAVIGSMAVMDKYDITGGFKAISSMLGIAAALTVLSFSLRSFSSLDPGELTKALLGVAVTMGSISGSFVLMGKFIDEKSVIATTGQILAMGSAVLLISFAVKKMGQIKFKDLSEGIGAMVVSLGAISGSFLLMSRFSGDKTTATAMQFVAIAGSMVMLAAAIKLLSMMGLKDLATGIGAMVAVMAAVAGFDYLTSGKSLMMSSVGLLAMAVAMNALIVPIFAIGNFPLDKLAVGLIGMTAALMGLALVTKILGVGPTSIIAAVAIGAMAIALNLLIVPIGILAAMGWGAMLTGIVGLGLALGVVAGAGILLAPAVIPLLGFAAALGLMSLAMLAAGAGMSLFGTGLVALSGLSVAAVGTIIAALGAFVTGLASLAPKLAEFITNIMIKIGTTVRDKAPEIIKIVGETIVRVLTTISIYIPQFVKAIVKLVTSVIDTIATEAPKVIDSMVNLAVTMIEKMAEAIDKYGPRFINACLGLIGSVLTIMVQAGSAVTIALFGWIPGVEGAMKKVSEKAEKAIDDALDSARIGEEKGEDFADGIASKTDEAEESGKLVAESANKGFSLVDGLKAGVNLVKGFVSGLVKGKEDVANAATDMAGAADEATEERLDINSPAKEGHINGYYYGLGVAEGVEDSTSLVEKAATHMADKLDLGLGDTYAMVQEKLFIKNKDVKENQKQATMVEESYKGIADSQKTMRSSLDEAFVKSRDSIEEQKYYQKLSLQEELDAWKKIQQKYKEGTDERKQANREVFRVEQELYKKGFQDSKEWIDDRKYYQKLSIEEELATWLGLQKKYKQGTEERKEADREVFRLQQEIRKKKEDAQKESFEKSKAWIDKETNYNKLSLKEELEAWERIQKRYKKGTDERKEADLEVYRIKNEINQKLISLNEEYIDRINQANQELIDGEKYLNEEYERVYADRVKSLTDFVGLFDKVKTQDQENPITGTQLVDNLRGQVNTFATWADDIKRLAQKGVDEGLLKTLEDMGPNAATEIAALNQLTSSQLTEYVELWKKKNELAKTQATSELVSLREETNKQIDQLRVDTEARLDVYKDEWVKKISEIKDGTKEEFVELNADMNTIGKNAMDGLIKGLSDKESAVYAKAKKIAETIEKTIKTALDINSPSRVTMGLGEFAGLGLAEGLSNSVAVVTKRAKDLSSKAVDSINKFLSTLQEPTMDNEINFKAVLDDSEITNFRKNLSGINVPYYLNTTNGLVSSALSRFRQNDDKSTNSSKSRPQSPDQISNVDHNRPIVIQSILNGRVIAEETVSDISRLMGSRTSLEYAMRGV